MRMGESMKGGLRNVNPSDCPERLRRRGFTLRDPTPGSKSKKQSAHCDVRHSRMRRTSATADGTMCIEENCVLYARKTESVPRVAHLMSVSRARLACVVASR